MNQVNYSRLVTLNETAAFLWRAVEGKDFSAEDLRDALTDAYEVRAEVAAADVEKLIGQWREMGLIEGE